MVLRILPANIYSIFTSLSPNKHNPQAISARFVTLFDLLGLSDPSCSGSNSVIQIKVERRTTIVTSSNIYSFSVYIFYPSKMRKPFNGKTEFPQLIGRLGLVKPRTQPSNMPILHNFRVKNKKSKK